MPRSRPGRRARPLPRQRTPLVADTDRDNVLDGAECALGTDPANAASRPVPAFLPDSDGDGLRDDIEVRGYNTNPGNTNTDGDACGDRREVASVDGNTTVGASDLGLIASAFGNYGLPVPAGQDWRTNMDLGKNGAVNAGDLGLAASAFGSCP